MEGRWRILSKKIEHHRSVKRTCTAACILHNFCLLQGDNYEGDNDRAPPDGQDDGRAARGGEQVRQLLMQYLTAEGVL